MPSSFEMPASFESIITFEKSEQKNALTSYYLKTIKSRLYRNGSRTVYICLDRSFQARIAGWNKENNHFVTNCCMLVSILIPVVFLGEILARVWLKSCCKDCVTQSIYAFERYYKM